MTLFKNLVYENPLLALPKNLIKYEILPLLISRDLLSFLKCNKWLSTLLSEVEIAVQEEDMIKYVYPHIINNLEKTYTEINRKILKRPKYVISFNPITAQKLNLTNRNLPTFENNVLYTHGSLRMWIILYAHKQGILSIRDTPMIYRAYFVKIDEFLSDLTGIEIGKRIILHHICSRIHFNIFDSNLITPSILYLLYVETNDLGTFFTDSFNESIVDKNET